HMAFDKLLYLTVAHELGHAWCNDKSEQRANQVAQILLQGNSPSCEPSLVARSGPEKKNHLNRTTIREPARTARQPINYEFLLDDTRKCHLICTPNRGVRRDIPCGAPRRNWTN